jgi:hypothetical protein
VRSLLPPLLSCLAAVSVAQAQARADPALERAELLRLHARDRTAHFETDVDLLLERSSEEMLFVSEGEIRRTGKAEQRQMLGDYFRDAKYDEWEDLEEPIVRVSDDGSMAWMIIRLRVRRTQRDATGADREQAFVYAGITTYEKVNGEWLEVANVSTFEPPK